VQYGLLLVPAPGQAEPLLTYRLMVAADADAAAVVEVEPDLGARHSACTELHDKIATNVEIAIAVNLAKLTLWNDPLISPSAANIANVSGDRPELQYVRSLGWELKSDQRFALPVWLLYPKRVDNQPARAAYELSKQQMRHQRISV
jgi:hypothetical protein